jgi:hypothetical protein
MHICHRTECLIAASLLALSTTALADTAPPTTLCTADEQVLFDCAIKGKQKRVSVCARYDLDSDKGELRYRFGKPGSVELTYPEQAQGSLGKFTYSAYLRGGGPENAGLDLFSLLFRNGEYQYEVFSEYSVEDDSSQYGVRIHGSKEAELICASPVTDHLRSANLEQILAAEPDQ